MMMNLESFEPEEFQSKADAHGLARLSSERPTPIKIEHPSGMIEVVMDCQMDGAELKLNKAGLLRTARKLFSGTVHIPTEFWFYSEQSFKIME